MGSDRAKPGHQYYSIVHTNTLSDNRKVQLLEALRDAMHYRKVSFNSKEHMWLVKLVVDAINTIDISAAPVVFILASVVWDMCEKGAVHLYVIKVTENSVSCWGDAGNREKEEYNAKGEG